MCCCAALRQRFEEHQLQQHQAALTATYGQVQACSALLLTPGEHIIGGCIMGLGPVSSILGLLGAADKPRLPPTDRLSQSLCYAPENACALRLS